MTTAPTLTDCPGDAGGHNWALVKDEADVFWPTHTRRTLFKKRLVKGDILRSFPVVGGIFHHWHCTKCRQFDTTYEASGKTMEDYLKKGYAVGGRLPELTTREARAHG